MQAKLIVLLLLCYFNLALAELIGTSVRTGTGFAEYVGCQAAVKKYKFDYKALGKGSYSSTYDVVCGYPPAVGSMLLCFEHLAHNKTSFRDTIIVRQLVRRCNAYSSYIYDLKWYQDQYTNATQNYIDSSGLNVSKALYKATLPKETYITAAYTSSKNGVFDWDAGTFFSIAFYGYFLLLVIISFFYNTFRLTGFTKVINTSNVSKLFQKWIIFPTLIPNGKYSQASGFKWFTMLFPNRIQFITDLLFFGMEIGFYCTPYKSGYTVSYLGFRSGIMAFGKIPLLILFAGRNNILLWITGWSYSTFMHFHKMVALWMFVDCVIHSAVYTIDVLGSYVKEMQEVYFASGIAATVFCGVIVLQSFHIFRNFYYEYFLTMHVIFAICFLATCWWHCNILGWMEWMVAACCVWFYDRLIRVIRMCAFGYRTANLTVVGDQLFKIEVSKPAWWLHSSGTYGYIYFAGYLFWENHPFTVVVEDGRLCAYIRVKKGVTARIWKQLVLNNNTIKWKVCIEGPYGGSLSTMAKRYNEVIFVAGGSGAPGVLEGATKATTGKFIWISQTLGFVTAYQSLIEQIDIPIDIYITRENANDRRCSKKELLSDFESDTQSSDGSEKNVTDKECCVSSQISIYYQRPDLAEVINCEVTEATSNNVAIVACGPPVLMDNLRNIVTTNVTKWDKSFDFFDEYQIW